MGVVNLNVKQGMGNSSRIRTSYFDLLFWTNTIIIRYTMTTAACLLVANNEIYLLYKMPWFGAQNDIVAFP